MKNTNNQSIGFPALLGLAFIILKLTDAIDWSWWWVLSPWWISLLLVLIITIVVLMINRK